MFILPAGASPSEKRLALVVGNASYKVRSIPTAAADAKLLGQTLRAEDFDVSEVHDLDAAGLRASIRDFLDRAAKAGPQTVAAIYFAGCGLQIAGENYLLSVDADVREASDASRFGVKLSDLARALSAIRGRAAFLVADAARKDACSSSALASASGLAWLEAEPNVLVAYNAAPGTVPSGVAEGDDYGVYAKALAEMLREGNLAPDELFVRVRLRVHQATGGAQVPWHISGIPSDFVFLPRTPDVPNRRDPDYVARVRSKPMSTLDLPEAYFAALARDTFDAYTDFLADHWREPMARRIRALLAARRESMIWRRTCQANTPEAFWTYLERYPRGPHVAEAGSLLRKLNVATASPPVFARLEYEVPSPLPDEAEYIERPALVLDDPSFAFAPPPSAPNDMPRPAASNRLVLTAPPDGHALDVPPSSRSETKSSSVLPNVIGGLAGAAGSPMVDSTLKETKTDRLKGETRQIASPPPTVARPLWTILNPDSMAASPEAARAPSVPPLPEWASLKLAPLTRVRSSGRDPVITGAVSPSAAHNIHQPAAPGSVLSRPISPRAGAASQPAPPLRLLPRTPPAAARSVTVASRPQPGPPKPAGSPPAPLRAVQPAQTRVRPSKPPAPATQAGPASIATDRAQELPPRPAGHPQQPN